MLTLFLGRDPARVTPRIAIGLAKMMGHHDDGYSMRMAPENVRAYVRHEVLSFAAEEIAKLLSYIGDGGFERPSTGYSLMPVLGARADCLAVFAAIRDDAAFEAETRRLAGYLVELDAQEPFRFWHAGAID
jgi:hypothetical protein